MPARSETEFPPGLCLVHAQLRGGSHGANRKYLSRRVRKPNYSHFMLFLLAGRLCEMA